MCVGLNKCRSKAHFGKFKWWWAGPKSALKQFSLLVHREPCNKLWKSYTGQKRILFLSQGFQDSSWHPGGRTGKASAGKASLGLAGGTEINQPLSQLRAGAALAGAVWAHRSLWPCLSKIPSWSEVSQGRASWWVFGKANSESQFYEKAVALSVCAPFHPFPHPGFDSASRGERHFQNSLCCFLNKTKRKQNLDFVITNNDCDTYLLPKNQKSSCSCMWASRANT